MGVSVNKIPSAGTPFVDKQGRISPVWYEFFRSFISKTVESTTGSGAEATVDFTAGAGLVEAVEGTFSVGAGSGLTVNADDVSIDIASLTRVQGVLDDEIVISRPQDNNSIKKTRLRDVAGLSSPGGLTTQVQYNNNGSFEGDSNLTYDGAGSLSINGTLTINGTTFSSATNADKYIFQVPSGSSTTHFTFKQSGTSSSDMPMDIQGYGASVSLNLENNAGLTAATTQTSSLHYSSKGTVYWTIGLNSESSGREFTLGTTALNAGQVFTVDATNMNFRLHNSLLLSTSAGLTASTTQTQGQGALTKDVNEVSVCANANDVRTLPAALAGRTCLVINNGAQTLQVFPASGDNLGAGVDTSTTIAAGSRKWFVAFDTTNWEPVI